MPNRSLRTLAIAALCVSLWTPLLAPTARGAEHHERWVPSIGLNFGIEIQDTDTSSETSDILGPPVDPPTAGIPISNPIRPSTSGDSYFSIPSISGSLEIMTPSPLDDWGRPRLFARFGVGADLAAKIRPSGEKAISSPMRPPPDVPWWTEDEIIGQGSKTEMSIDELELTASMGIAFETTFDERPLRIRPSFEFVRREVTGEGKANRAIQIVPRIRNQLRDISDTRLEYFSAEKSKDLHGIGPGIEFEVEASRVGPMVFTVYAGFTAYYFLGDLDFGASDTNEYGESAAFDFEVDEWSYRGNAGIRIGWAPE